MALAQIVADPPTAACPALSAGTPVLFGAPAVKLRLTAPARVHAESYDTEALKIAGFPSQRDRFVGRTRVMARASAALALASRVPGVLLYGMPGGGKTACALELAYTHEHAFDRLVWFKAPDEGRDIINALTDFALTLELKLPGFQMVHVLENPDKFAAFLPQLTELVERRRVLIVIDNIESLLSESGQWRDARWGQVIGALCAHTGHGRVLLTSRRLPTSVAGLLVQAVDALSLDEALLLARELPRLHALIEGELDGIDSEVARGLALAVLNIAQGHPMLLELANGQAANPAQLDALVQAGDQAWQQAGGLPDGFFASGESQATMQNYLHVLGTWTKTVADALTPGQRTMLSFLCCLEETDRIRPVADANWVDLWGHLNLSGQPPELDETLAALTTPSLIAIRRETGNVEETYRIHPGVASAGRTQAGKDFQDAVDAELAAFWIATLEHALEREDEGPTTTLVVRSGMAAARYLIRLGEWARVAMVLHEAFDRDRSRATAAAVLPALQAVAATGQVPAASHLLAKVLQEIDPATAEGQMRTHLDHAVARGDWLTATVTAENLSYICRESGRLAEALTLSEQMADYTRQAGLGPWTQLSDEAKRLQVLSLMGQATQVLDEVLRLREQMEALPAVSEREVVTSWDVRESLLRAGRDSAQRLGRWELALDLNAAILSSQRDRGAPDLGIAKDRFNAYGPLIRLGRLDEALTLLRDCRQAFEDAQEVHLLGYTFGALAELEARQGHGDVAMRLQQDCLRYTYFGNEAANIAVAHRNLGTYLHAFARQPASALAHHLADALINTLASGGDNDESMRAVASDLRALGVDAPVPVDVADLCHRVAAVPGVKLERLLATLVPHPHAAQQALQDLTACARDLTATPP